MLNIKTFQDGNRLIVVFEGIDNIPEEQKMIQGFLSSIISTAQSQPAQVSTASSAPVVESIPPVEAAPVESDNEPPVIPSTFEDGPYKGCTPEEILEGDLTVADKTIAFNYLKEIHVKEPFNPLSDKIQSALDGFVKERFQQTDAKAYSNKLAPKQIQLFYNMHKDACHNEFRERVFAENKVASWGEFLQLDESILRKTIQDMVIEFQSH